MTNVENSLKTKPLTIRFKPALAINIEQRQPHPLSRHTLGSPKAVFEAVTAFWDTNHIQPTPEDLWMITLDQDLQPSDIVHLPTCIDFPGMIPVRYPVPRMITDAIKADAPAYVILIGSHDGASPRPKREEMLMYSNYFLSHIEHLRQKDGIKTQSLDLIIVSPESKYFSFYESVEHFFEDEANMDRNGVIKY